MGFFDKTNPRATRRSLTLWAIWMGVLGGLLGLYTCIRNEMPLWATILIVPGFVMTGAFSGWIMEWQLPEEVDEEAAPDTAPDQSTDARDNKNPNP